MTTTTNTQVLSDLTPYLIKANVGKTADKTVTATSNVPFGFDDGIPNWPAGIKPTILDSTVFGHPVLQCNIPRNDGSTKTRCEVWANLPQRTTPQIVDLSTHWNGRTVIRRGDTVQFDFEVYTDLAGWGERDDYGQIIFQLQGERSGKSPWTGGPVEVQVRNGQWLVGGGEGVWKYYSTPFTNKTRTTIGLVIHFDGPGKGYFTAVVNGVTVAADTKPQLGTIYDDQQFLIPRPALYGGNIPDRRYVNFGSWKAMRV